MGPDTPHGTGPGHIPSKGHTTAHREADGMEGGGEMGISSAGGSDG